MLMSFSKWLGFAGIVLASINIDLVSNIILESSPPLINHMSLNVGSQYFQQAIDYFQDKVNIKGEAWDSLWQGQHAAAFTVAGAMKDDLLCDLRQSVDKAISEGMSLASFRHQFKEIVAKHGWTGFTGEGSKAGVAWRAKVIYDTNMRQAYNAGRWQQLQQFDVWVYRHGDSRFSDADAPPDEALRQPLIHNRAGYWRQTDVGRVYLFNSAGLREALKGHDFGRALGYLQQAGMMPPTGSDGKNSKGLTIQGKRGRWYEVRQSTSQGGGV